MSVALPLKKPQANPPQKAMAWPLIGLVLVLAAACLLRWPIASIPLERDEGEYAYIAQHWLQGETPYQTAFDQKPPAVFVAYVVIEAVFGTSPTAIHWATQLYTLGTLVLVFWLGQRLFSPTAGLLAAGVAAFLTAAPGFQGNAANTEVFMLLPVTAAFAAALRAGEKDSLSWAFATGLFAGAALLFKQVALFHVLFCLYLLLQICQRRRRAVAAMVGGMAATGLPVVVYFAVRGAGWDFYDCILGYNLQHASQAPLSHYPALGWFPLARILSSCWPVFGLAFLGLVLGWGASLAHGVEKLRPGRLVTIWLIFACLAVLPGGHFYPHYFLHLVPPLALLAANGATLLAAWLPSAGLRRTGATVLTCASVAYGIGVGWWYFGPGSVLAKSREIYGMNPFPESAAVAQFLTKHSRPSDTIFILGSEPQILYYADRKSATRYIITYPLWKPFPGTRERQKSVLAELAENAPALIVLIDVPFSNTPARGAPLLLANGVVGLLSRDYVPVAVVPASELTPMPLVTDKEELDAFFKKARQHPRPTLMRIFERREKVHAGFASKPDAS